MFEDEDLDGLQEELDNEELENEIEEDLEDLDEAVEDPEEEEDDDKSDVNNNLSKAVKAKNKEIAELKAKLAKQTEQIRKAPEGTQEYTPKEITQLGNLNYDGPSPDSIQAEIKKYDAFLKGPGGQKLYEDDPQLYNNYRIELTELKAELPKAVQATQYVRQAQKYIRDAFINNIMANHPEMDKKEATYIFDTADFNEDKPDTAIRKRIQEHEEMIKSRYKKYSSKEKTKSKLTNNVSKGSNYAIPTDAKKAKVMKAMEVLKKDPQRYRDLKEHAEFLKERNPKKYPKGLMSYVALKADKIIKGEI